MKIQIHNHTSFDINAYQQLLTKLFSKVKEQNKMHLVFVTQKKIQQLNAFFRKKDFVTDVLSFPNDFSFNPNLKDDSLGDVFICFEQAQIQAQKLLHSLEREIAFLAVHGFLHLKGYQHRNEEELKKMIHLKEQILKKMNLERKNN
ncbi:Endoribonuclease YbeY [Candidatus Phytoplasma solani]|uniref:rRNA maturation RNase YbeY n=1 Tax=Candidatus Phytoplasma solani TaxID=69896 RepID=UPI0032DB99AE